MPRSRLQPAPVPRPAAILLAAGLLLLAASACRTPTSPPAAAAAGPAAILAAAAHALPHLRFENVDEYPGERIYDYMDGAAVPYVERHVRVLAAGDVWRGAVQTKVEVYEMPTPAEAAALFREFSAPGGTAQLAAGQAGCYWLGTSPEAIFHRGRHFVRVLAYARDDASGLTALTEVAAGLDRHIPGG